MIFIGDKKIIKPIIEVRGLKKSYGDVKALDNVSFSVCKGQRAVLLGPNGAGKTTIMNVLSGVLSYDSGSVLIDGISGSEHSIKLRRKIGVVFQKGLLDRSLSLEENLCVRGRFYGLKGKALHDRVVEISEITGIDKFITQPYGSLSGGQQRRCDIARALIHDPAVLLLDEPATGLDPEIRCMIWKTIETLRSRTGMTVFMTTHYMEEAASAEKIIIMNRGKIAAEGDYYSLQKQYGGDHLNMITAYKEKLEVRLKRVRKMYDVKPYKGLFIFHVPLNSTMEALSVLKNCEGFFSDFEVIKGTMDNVYFNVLERSNTVDRFYST